MNWKRISEAARQLGVSVETLKNYERRGWITPQRAPNGYRMYSEQAIRQLLETRSKQRWQREVDHGA